MLGRLEVAVTGSVPVVFGSLSVFGSVPVVPAVTDSVVLGRLAVLADSVVFGSPAVICGAGSISASELVFFSYSTLSMTVASGPFPPVYPLASDWNEMLTVTLISASTLGRFASSPQPSASDDTRSFLLDDSAGMVESGVFLV